MATNLHAALKLTEGSWATLSYHSLPHGFVVIIKRAMKSVLYFLEEGQGKNVLGTLFLFSVLVAICGLYFFHTLYF